MVVGADLEVVMVGAEGWEWLSELMKLRRSEKKVRGRSYIIIVAGAAKND